MRLAIIGAGNVGKALGNRFASTGHDVLYGVRDPAKSVAVPAGSLRAVADAVRASEVILIATPWSATEAACRSLGDVREKIVIDCTNPLGMTKEGLGLLIGHDRSGGEMVAQWCPGAYVFKTFNQTGFEIMADPGRVTPRPVMFVAGDSEPQKAKVLDLVRDVGFEAVDAGPLASARLLEPYAMVWIDQVIKRGAERGFAFSIARFSQR